MIRIGLSILVIALCVPVAWGATSHLTPLIGDLSFSKAGEATLFEFAKTKGADQSLQNLVKSFPKLRIIVLNLEIGDKNIRGEKIRWKGNVGDAKAHRFYHDFTSSMIQSVAYFIAPGKELESVPGRPLIDYPLLVLKNRTPRHALLHELMHFLLYLEFEKTGFTIEPGSSAFTELLAGIFDQIGEETFVDSYLLEKSQQLGFSQKDMCYRHRYLRQNQQVLWYFLTDEIPSLLKGEGRDPNKSQQLARMMQAYNKSSRLRARFDLDCKLFFFNLKKN